ncbi:MAG TPA: DUF2520 domain-containing protein [Candidatus Aquilonibacter sp.]|nr:DUF2520 domain-containing protein [Candidatus Aquilonibacter sp.]
MPTRANAKSRIAIVGAGNLANALAVGLHWANYTIDEIVSRASVASVKRARALAREVRASASTIYRARLQAEIVWFCVPDREIAGTAELLSGATDWHGKVALHSSGALTSDTLEVLRRRGAAVASVHPLMTFVRDSRALPKGVPFALEGDPKALRIARALVLQLRGDPFTIHKRYKQAYHAWGMFLSPLFIALLAAAERVAGAAGFSRHDARKRMLPILRQTLTNYDRMGAAQSFSGPIARGDVDTVSRHLEELGRAPAAGEVYVALVRLAMRELPVKNRAAFLKILGPAAGGTWEITRKLESKKSFVYRLRAE